MYNGLMTPDMISILAVGVALAGLILNSQRQQRRETEQLRTEMISRTGKLTAEVAGLRRDVGGLDARLSRLEGVVSTLEGVVSTALFNRPPLVESAEHGD